MSCLTDVLLLKNSETFAVQWVTCVHCTNQCASLSWKWKPSNVLNYYVQCILTAIEQAFLSVVYWHNNLLTDTLFVCSPLEMCQQSPLICRVNITVSFSFHLLHTRTLLAQASQGFWKHIFFFNISMSGRKLAQFIKICNS